MYTPNQTEEFYSLTDLVSIDKLQKIQDAFAEASQVASTITDLDGIPITTPSNHSDVCKMTRASEKGAAKCKRSAEVLGAEAARTMRPTHQKCLSCGFTDAAAPIIVDGKHIANWLIGQYYIRDVDENHIREFAREIEVDEDDMADAFKAMPKLSKERFERVLSFLWLMANEISAMGYQNLLQRKQTEELKRVKFQLEKHKNELEALVAERTSALLKANEKLSLEIELKTRVEKEQSRLIAAIENAAEAIIITDAAANIIYVNPSFEKITGYSADEIRGKNPSMFKSGLHDDTFYQEFWETIQKGKVWKGRFSNKNKDGSICEADTTVTSIKDGNDKIINYVAVKRDVTKELELERQLQQKSKLESIGTLAAGIAHEINTPVQYVRDNTKFLEDALEDLKELDSLYQSLITTAEDKQLFPEEVKKIHDFSEEIDIEFLSEESSKAVEGALEGLERISSIVQAMKEFSHPGEHEKKPEDINKLIESTLLISRNEWKSFANINFIKNPKLPSVPLISGQFKQVILNLLVNAAHSIAEKVSGKADDQGMISISSDFDDDTVKIHVKDSGTGIPENSLKRIFDPFFTTKEVGKGSGQGLSMAYKTIVDGHGGKIDVQSKVGVGTEFILTLPR